MHQKKILSNSSLQKFNFHGSFNMSEHCTIVYGFLKLSVKELSKVAEALSLDKKTLVKYF